jgi:Flp pilus assembly protein TadG
MSFTIVEPAPARLNRSELAVPGSNPKLFKKAAESAADVVFLDLEDAVAPDEKVQARKNIIQALNEVDWGDKTSRCASTASTPTTCTATWSTCSSRAATGSTSS